MLFLTDAVIHGGPFNSSNFIADFGCSTEKLAEFHNESKRLKVFNFSLEYETFLCICNLNCSKTFHV